MQRIVSEELKLTASESLAVEALITELGRAQEKHPTYASLEHALNVQNGVWQKLCTEVEKYGKRCDPCIARRLLQIAAVALRTVVDLNLPVKYAPKAKPTVPISVASGIHLTPEDLDRIRESFAKTGRATIERPNGTKAHYLGVPTGAYEAAGAGSSVAVDTTYKSGNIGVARGPMHHDEDEVGFGQPYDSHGG